MVNEEVVFKTECDRCSQARESFVEFDVCGRQEII